MLRELLSKGHQEIGFCHNDLQYGKKPSDAEVEQLVNVVEKYTLANHLFWGLWGLISSYVNTIDFDYKEYSRQRFQKYWLKKPILLT
ncbi:hypothetical protein P8452_50856 [Trifolium repens]|nr:hypothetical protein P8452_50856 [Trifolium repens]